MRKTVYDTNYYNNIGSGSARSAEIVIPLVQKLISPSSVADIGCGTGLWLSVWQKNGVSDIAGVDGEHITPSMLCIDPLIFKPHNLEKPFDLGRKFDMIQSLEVAEHIHQEFASTFIHCLCSHSDLVLFSASIPEQGGVNHFNEQYPDYWIRLFSENNFVAIDCFRKDLWNNNAVDTCYRQNILLFVRKNKLQFYPLLLSYTDPILPMVHPETYAFRNRIIRDYEKILSTPFHANWFIAKRIIKKVLQKIGLWK